MIKNEIKYLKDMVESGGHRQFINVSSIAHRFAYINFDDIKAENNTIRDSRPELGSG